MNRTDRLLAIILQIQAKGCQRAEDLAVHFEVSKRTIYRDIEALYQAGVPVISTPGQGYTLTEGYFLPPLSFTLEEATMLLLGADMMRQSFDSEYATAAQSAAEKITTVLPPALHDRVQWMQQSLIFLSPELDQADRLRQLRRAIIRQQRVHFGYHARYGEADTGTEREVDPYRLAYVEGNWHLTAYCHLRKAMRIFRLGRMQDLTILPQTFNRRAGALQQQEREMQSSGQLIVRLLFGREASRWVEEDRFFFIDERQNTPDGLLVTLRIRRIEDILQWVLGWGQNVRILEPDSLRQRVAEEARAILKNLEPNCC